VNLPKAFKVHEPSRRPELVSGSFP